MIIDSPIISGSYAASGSLNQLGDITITGSLTVTGDITGNITGSATNAVSASFASTAISASHAANATSASYAAAATSASFSSTASYLENYIPPFPFTGSAGISGSLVVNGNITAQTLVVQTITSSEDFVTGSTHFGSIIDNTHQFTGSVTVSGSLAVNGSSAVLTNQTGAMSVATASYVANAVSASYASTASLAPLYLPLAGGNMTGDIYAAGRTFTFQDLLLGAGTTFGKLTTDGSKYISIMPTYNVESVRFWPNGNVTIQDAGTYVDNGFKLDVSGSGRFTNGLIVTGSLNAVNGVTGSLLGTSSFADNATSASYALTASYSANVPETASFAVSASQAQNAVSAAYSAYALTSSYSLAGSGFPFSGSAVITGSLLITNLSSSGVSYLVADASGNITAQTASAAIRSTQTVVATSGQTTFNITNGYTTGLVDVFVNGTKLNSDEFTDTNGTTIILATGSFVDDVVEFEKYFPASGVTNNALRQQTTFTASAGQTVFSASYTPGLLDVFYNGSRLSNGEYTANTGTYFTLATGSAEGDILDVFVYSYQVGAFSGIGGAGVANQVAYFNTSNSITGSPNFTISGSTMTVTGSLLVSGSGTFTNIGPAVFSGSVTAVGGFSGSFSGTATSASYAVVATTASYADSLTVAGTLTAQTLVVQTITSSVDFVTGSTRFGSISENTHQFTGSVLVTGSTNINGNAVVTGSLKVNKIGINIGDLNLDNFSTFGLIVSGSIGFGNSGGAAALVDRDGSGNTTFYGGAGDIKFSDITLTSNYLTIKNAGNVGIGTTTPDRLFHINGNTSTTTPLQKVQNDGVGDAVTEYRITGISWYVGIDNSDGDKFKIGQDPLGTSDRFTIADGGAATFLSTVTATNGVRCINSGVDAVFQDAFVGVYSSNNNEQNAIQASVSSTAQNSGFRFQASNGGGSTGRTTVADFLRDRQIFYHNVLPASNGTQDLGSSSLRWGTVYTSDLDMSNGIGDYTIVEGEEDLFLYNNKTSKVFKFLIQEVDPSEATPKMKK
jgi:hypothetical protein